MRSVWPRKPPIEAFADSFSVESKPMEPKPDSEIILRARRIKKCEDIAVNRYIGLYSLIPLYSAT